MSAPGPVGAVLWTAGRGPAAAGPRRAGGQAAAQDSSLPTWAKMAGDEAGVTLGQPHLSRQDLGTLVSAARGATSGSRGSAGAAEWARAAARGAPNLLLGPAVADALRGAREAVAPRGAAFSTRGGVGRGPKAEDAGREQGTGAEGRGRGQGAENGAQGRGRGQGAGPAGPAGCGAPGEALLLPVSARLSGSVSRWRG